MVPSTGRIIHLVDQPTNTCIAAIITGKIKRVITDEGSRFEFFATTFPPHGPVNAVGYKTPVGFDSDWHDPRECKLDQIEVEVRGGISVPSPLREIDD